LTLAGSWNSAYIGTGTPATAEEALFAAMNEGKAYWNIHTQANPGGEIRGWITAVPEPSSIALASLGILGVAARIWSKRREKNS
jgi:hypothetical protein